jgi:O-antigen ligase
LSRRWPTKKLVGTQISQPLIRQAVSNHAGSEEVPPVTSRLAVHLERIIFYTLLGLIALLATPYGIVNPWRGAIEAVFEITVFVLGALWMIEGMLSGRWVTNRHLLLLPLLLIIGLACVQTLSWETTPDRLGLSIPLWQSISYDPYETQLSILKLLAYALALGLFLKYTSTPARLKVLVLFLVGIAVASALFALIRQTTQHGTQEFLFPSVRLDRGFGQFVNRNHFAFLMEMALGLLLGLMAGVGKRRERLLLYLTAAIPIWAALVLSSSRGGILSMLCQLLMGALMFSYAGAQVGTRTELRSQASWSTWLAGTAIFRLALGGVLLAAALTGIIWVGGEQVVSRFETIPIELAVVEQESNTGVSRKEIWAATWQMIKDHPLMGVGFGGYWVAVPQYHNASGKMAIEQAHNDYLEFLASMGLTGLLPGVLMVFLLLRFARASMRSVDPDRRAACFGALLGLFGIGIHSLVDFGLHIPVNALFCLALSAIATLNGRVERKGLLTVKD